MQDISQNPAGILFLLIWALAWGLGGIWLVKAALRLAKHEQVMVGLLVGMVMENVLANWLARILPVNQAAWAAALLVLALGFVLVMRSGWRSALDIPIQPLQLLVFLAILWISFQIGRGMPINDDYAHLPTTSMMAAGSIPPVFSLDPSVAYGYHDSLTLFAAQIVRLGNLYIWTALDLARALSFSLAILLAALFARRVTGNRLAGLLGGAMAAFGSGARWLLLLLPPQALNWLSGPVQMLGSGQASGANLADALLHSWASLGGPMAFPFAFINGVIQPGVMDMFNITGLMATCIPIVLLLTFNRWRGWLGGAISVLLIAATGLIYELAVALFLAAWALITLLYVVRHKSLHLPRTLRNWLWVTGLGTLLALIQGGAWTDTLTGIFQRIIYHNTPTSYQTIQFTVSWIPAIVSQQLGVLSLINVRQLIVALAEVGPLVLVLPFLAVWGIKAYRSGRWFEAAYVLAGFLSFGMLFVRFSGVTGVANTSRLFDFMGLARLYAIPLGWVILKKLSGLKLSLAFVAMFAGFIILGVDLMAIQKPVELDYLTTLDAQVMQKYWNRLPKDAMVFDWNPNRSVVVFGRAVNSSSTWYTLKPEWKALTETPGFTDLLGAGYAYVYLDRNTWDRLDSAVRSQFERPCVKLLDEVDAKYKDDFRRLYDISACGQ